MAAPSNSPRPGRVLNSGESCHQWHGAFSASTVYVFVNMTAEGVERGAQLALTCPACSPESEELHEVIKPDTHATVRCRSCGHVHKTTLDSSPTVSLRGVVSIEEESERIEVEVPSEEVLAVGEEFVAETDDGPMGVRITSLELSGGGRTDEAHATEIGTIWTRGVDNVAVDATIHPPNREHDETRSETYYLPGDEELVVGESIPHLDEDVTIEGIILRDDAITYDRRKLDRPGRSARAKDVRRLYVRATAGDTWRSPWG